MYVEIKLKMFERLQLLKKILKIMHMIVAMKTLSISDDRRRYNTSEFNTTSQEKSDISAFNHDFKVRNRREGVDPSSGESIVGRIVSREGK